MTAQLGRAPFDSHGIGTVLTTLSGPRSAERFRQLAGLPCFVAQPPDSIMLDHSQIAVSPDWADQLASVRMDGIAFWKPSEAQLGFTPKSDGLTYVSMKVDAFTLGGALALIEPVPFELCAFGSAFHGEWVAAKYERWGFSRRHISHGWGCAFRGGGHDLLVSRRWLDFGPWRVIQRPNDTTLIQFHDLAITDPAEAFEQARLGHERMGISGIGGFIQQNSADFMLESVRGIYLPDLRRLEIVTPPGESVDPFAMTCACAMRLQLRAAERSGRKWKPGTIGPTDSIAYIFIDELQARAHLHELWLRELECWVVDGDGKRRLDDSYHPVPDPPAWVRRLG